MRIAWLLLVVGCSGSSAPKPETPGSVVPSDGGLAQTPDATVATTCAGPAPSPDHKCVENCGPPVSRDTDPPPGWSWLSPDEVKSRNQFGCPRCLPPATLIATPDGDRPIGGLAVGARVFTVDEAGRRIEARIIYIGSTPVSGMHQMVRLTLADGRVIAGSAGHPDGEGRALGAMAMGDRVDGSAVSKIEVVPFSGDRTWDLLPSGNTGLYVANGVVLRSTFFDGGR